MNLKEFAKKKGLKGMDTSLGYTIPCESEAITFGMALAATVIGIEVVVGFCEEEGFYYIRERGGRATDGS